MKLWFDMIKKYSKRDQISFPYAAKESQLKFLINVYDSQGTYPPYTIK